MYKISQIIIPDDEKNIVCNVYVSDRSKNIRLKVNPLNGVSLSIPKFITIKEGINFVQKNVNWIKAKLELIENITFVPSYFGKKIEIIQNFSDKQKKHQVTFKDDTLNIISPKNSIDEKKWIYERWLKAKAKEYLPKRAYELADKYNFKINKVTVRETRSRWGSCSKKRNISLSSNLLKFRTEVIDYVIIHELCHTIEMNHSKKFWSMVEKYYPNYKSLKSELKKHTI